MKSKRIVGLQLSQGPDTQVTCFCQLSKQKHNRERAVCALITQLCENNSPMEEYGKSKGGYDPSMTALLCKLLHWEGGPKSWRSKIPEGHPIEISICTTNHHFENTTPLKSLKYYEYTSAMIITIAFWNWKTLPVLFYCILKKIKINFIFSNYFYFSTWHGTQRNFGTI